MHARNVHTKHIVLIHMYYTQTRREYYAYSARAKVHIWVLTYLLGGCSRSILSCFSHVPNYSLGANYRMGTVSAKLPDGGWP
jgi:hypothetical protein